MHRHSVDATPLHYATECILTYSLHMTKPNPQLDPIWFRIVATCKRSRWKIEKMVRHAEKNQDLFRINDHTFQIKTSSLDISHLCFLRSNPH
ncbi:hypothetical protein AVEN_140455-1 [Araneus ventricosus]|uniref:Uncharacterized protein n=1 Tax=Araneus ventricosus TaxID=182803 RepID=A0A4Y2MER1_ARAVE|nr:hypothetical protein AVEN_140455-1 [Araneus ventricosus]